MMLGERQDSLEKDASPLQGNTEHTVLKDLDGLIPKENVEQPINLTFTFLDCGRTCKLNADRLLSKIITQYHP